MRAELQPALQEALQTPKDDLPELFGELAQITGVVLARLMSGPAAAQESDRAMNVDEVAVMLCQSRDWVYEHQEQLGGWKEGGSLRFSYIGIQEYIRHKSILTARRRSPYPLTRRGK
jgi:hypothetical protein